MPSCGVRLSVTFICLSVRLSRWCIQWLKCHWMQGNAVPVPPIIEIQRSHASSFIKTLVAPQLPVRGPKADVQFSHLRFFTLTTERILSKRTNTSSYFFSPPGSHTSLVFPYQTLWQYSDGDPLNGAKLVIFDQYWHRSLLNRRMSSKFRRQNIGYSTYASSVSRDQ